MSAFLVSEGALLFNQSVTIIILNDAIQGKLFVLAKYVYIAHKPLSTCFIFLLRLEFCSEF